MKRCKRCNVEKENSDFYKNSKNRDGYHNYCILCTKTAGAVSRKKPESLRNKQDYQFRRKYGISLQEQEAILQSQNGKCKLCGCVPKRPCVDHCHSTGKVRGILCPKCNTALGFFGDNLVLIDRARNYLIDRL